MKMKYYNLPFLAVIAISFLSLAGCTPDDGPTPVPEPEPEPEIPCDGVATEPLVVYDFDCQKNVDLSSVETLNNVENPNKAGINLSDSSGLFVDNGTEAWDNLLIDFESPIDLSSTGELVFQVIASKEVPILVKLEGGTTKEFWGVLSASTEWQEYKFDLSIAADGGNSKLTIFFNAGQTDGESGDTYHIDNIRWQEPTGPDCSGVTEDLSIISDFECQNNYEFGGNSVEVVSNPFRTGINETDSVAEYGDDGTNAWDNLFVDLGAEIDLSEKSQLTVQIYSSKKVPVLAKLEGGSAVEAWGYIDAENEWTEYTFDFSCAVGGGNSKVILFFNGGQTDGAADDVYYVDNYRFTEKDVLSCEGVEPDLSIIADFECQVNQDLSGIAALSTVANPFKNCNLNRTDSVGRYVDDGFNAWDNLLIDFGQAMDLSSNNKLRVRVHASRAVPLLAKLEGGTSAPAEIWGSIDVEGEWKQYSFDFSSQAAESHNKVVLFFNGGQSSGSTEDIYYVDDLRFDLQ